VEQLCREAVLFGRTRLGFDRIGVWLSSAEPGVITGTFGIDERGELRNETGQRVQCPPDLLQRQFNAGVIRSQLEHHHPLFDHAGKTVGQGDHIISAIWNGHQVIGFLFADNLLNGQPLTELQCELLEHYAATLGHLYSQKQTEEALRQSEAKYRAFVEQIPAITYTVSLHDGAFLYMSPQVAGILHIPYDAFLNDGTLWFRLICPDDRERVSAEIGRCRTTGDPLSVEYRMMTRDGDLVWVHDAATTLCDAAGQPFAFQGVVFDITPRKQMEEALRNTNERLRNLINASPLAIITAKPDGQVTGWNPAAERLFGWGEAEVLGHPNPAIPSGNNGTSFRLNHKVVGGEMLTGVECTCLRKDNTPIEVNMWTSLLHNQQGEVTEIMGVAEDVTERKQAEERERELQQLQETERLRSEFLSFISHELKTPLTPILGAVELMQSGISGPTSPQQATLLEMVDRQSRRLQRLINDLLDLFQLERGQMSLVLEPVALPKIINESLSAYAKRYQDKGLYLRAELDASAPCISADAQRIAQIVDNLLENALKFTKTGGVTITLVPFDGWVRLQITDTGIGLSHPEIMRIFEPFFQVESHRQGGVGLGLTIVKQLVEAHGGTLHVESAGANQGSMFILLFPALAA